MTRKTPPTARQTHKQPAPQLMPLTTSVWPPTTKTRPTLLPLTPTTHTILPAKTRPILRTRSIITPQTTKSHNLHRLNERTPQTINCSVGSPLPSHGPTTTTGYLPPLENDTGTLYHPTYTASSRTAITCCTPLTKSRIPSLSKNAYLHTHARTKLPRYNLTLTPRNLRGYPTNVPRLPTACPRRPKIHQTHSNSNT